ncbi:MAG: hypothetical protein ABI846_08890 [Rudaea sp.]
MMSSPSHSHGRFSTTRWSVVMHVATAPDGDARTALAELVQRYWYPVYAYARRSGHTPKIAEEIARSFLGLLVEDFRGGTELQSHGHFRRFLLDRLDKFLGGDWRETVDAQEGADLVPPTDLEPRYGRDNADTASPSAAYERSFALEVISRALKRLRSEAGRAAHLPMFSALEPFLARDPSPAQYEQIAGQLSSRPLALIVALKRLRQRLRELVGEELADTVTSPEELAAEQSALHSILRRTPQ